MDLMAQARSLLQHYFGYPDFRPAQTAVIYSVLNGKDTLAVLPTGGGKSICFQIPALVLGGLHIVVSPLISLMQDQVEAAVARGIPAACLNSSLGKEEQSRVRSSIQDGSLRLLYVSPERLERLSLELQAAGVRPRLLVVDEAHCIAEWGHDFRPSYRRLARVRYRLGTPQTVALTGSATPAVRADIARSLRLRERYALHLGSFDRANLWFGAVRVDSEREHGGNCSCAGRSRAPGRPLSRRPQQAAPSRHSRRLPAGPGGRHRGNVRLRHGHRQAQRAAGGALDTSTHAGGLLSGGRQGRERWRVCPLRHALASGRRRAPPAAVGRHLSSPSRAGKNLEQSRESERRSGKRAPVSGAAQTGASAGAWPGRLAAGLGAAGEGGVPDSGGRQLCS